MNMKTIKVSEAIGPALDWAVAKCEEPIGGYKAWVQADLDKGILHGMNYSSDWLWGGPIIDREKISVMWRNIPNESYWYAEIDRPLSSGENAAPLVAAMRCYVASKLGDEVDVPEELC